MQMSHMDETTYNIVVNMTMAGFNLVNREGVLYNNEYPHFIKRTGILLGYVTKPALIKVSFNDAYINTEIYIDDECVSDQSRIADNSAFFADPASDNANTADTSKDINAFFTALAQSRCSNYSQALRLEAFFDWYDHFSASLDTMPTDMKKGAFSVTPGDGEKLVTR